MSTQPRLLTGDTPTGRLHLGHYVGSLENRLLLQNDYECYFMIANVQAFTTRMDKFAEVHDNVLEVAMDYLAVGLRTSYSYASVKNQNDFIKARDQMDAIFASGRLQLPFEGILVFGW